MRRMAAGWIAEPGQVHLRRFLTWRLAGLAALLALSAFAVRAAPPDPPARLADTGLYADFATLAVDPKNLAFAPQYPLWTDGATKRRWISLPAGTAIDASDPDAWVFPVGTRFWKEFSFAGRRVETRMIERVPDGSWRYAAYAWSADGREATLVPATGQRGAFAFGNGRSHTIPAVSDCKVCHEARRTPVLGFGLLQLSSDRDPAAPPSRSDERAGRLLMARPCPPDDPMLCGVFRYAAGTVEARAGRADTAKESFLAACEINRSWCARAVLGWTLPWTPEEQSRLARP